MTNSINESNIVLVTDVSPLKCRTRFIKKKINHICCGVTTYSYKVCIQMNYLEQLQYVKCNASNYEYIKGSLGSDSPCYPFFSFRTPIFSPFFPTAEPGLRPY